MTLKVKTDSSKDIKLLFSDRVTVNFKKRDGSYETLKGRWCNTCK
jgi:hypothetical protein